jgi:hypothetical protein
MIFNFIGTNGATKMFAFFGFLNGGSNGSVIRSPSLAILRLSCSSTSVSRSKRPQDVVHHKTTSLTLYVRGFDEPYSLTRA